MFKYKCELLPHMEPKPAVATAEIAETDVMAAVEEGVTDTFIIADIGQDGAFLTTPLEEAASLPAWR